MKHHLSVAMAACLATAAITGCPNQTPTSTTAIKPATTSSKAPSPSASAAAKAETGKSIMGTIKLPTGYNVISTGGGNFVSTNGGTVVPTGGGNVISTGGGNLRTVLKVDEAIAPGATVTLVDEDGDKVAGVAAVKADADGNYQFSNVPEGTYMVKIEAQKGDKKANFQTIVEAGDNNADVNAVSTIVAAGVLENLPGGLDQVDLANYETAVNKTEKTLETADLPDFSSESAVLEKFNQLSQEIAELKSLVQELSAKIDELEAKIEALTAQLGSQQSNGDCGIPQGLDADTDGFVTYEEFRIPPHETLTKDQVFRHLDTNKDQMLVAAEFCKAPPPPSGQTSSPPPGGNPPPPPPGDCGPEVAHVFVITGYTPKAGDVLQALRGDGVETPFSGPIQGGKATVKLPEGCPHKFRIEDSTGKPLVTGSEVISAQSGTAEITLKF